MELKKIEKLLNKRGLLAKKYFVYEKSTIFIDTGLLLIYIPSSLSIPSPDKNSRVIGIEPADTADSVNDLEFKQLNRIINQNSEIEDVAIMKKEKIYTGVRQRVWRSSRRSSLQLRVLIDLNNFTSNNKINKKMINAVHLEALFGMKFGSKNLLNRREEYVVYITSVIDEMKIITKKTRKMSELVESLREKSRRNMTFVSVDIGLAHLISKHEKTQRKNKLMLQNAKNIFKTVLLNFSKFALAAELATFSLAESSTQLATAQQQINSLGNFKNDLTEKKEG